MSRLLFNTEVESKIFTINDKKIILDSDVATLYGVQTKHVNQAVKNNLNKFPEGYIITLNNDEWTQLRSNFLTTKYSMSRLPPKAFTEKGLYMLATILKSKKAAATTIAIIEAFSKLRELNSTFLQLNQTNDSLQQEKLMKKTGSLISDLLDKELHISDTETTIELNLALVKIKHTIKRK